MCWLSVGSTLSPQGSHLDCELVIDELGIVHELHPAVQLDHLEAQAPVVRLQAVPGTDNVWNRVCGVMLLIQS